MQDFIAEARIQDHVPLFVAKRVKGALRHHASRNVKRTNERRTPQDVASPREYHGVLPGLPK
ncbi:DUF3562 domain-containing protein [Cupriavidus sp. 8B]